MTLFDIQNLNITRPHSNAQHVCLEGKHCHRMHLAYVHVLINTHYSYFMIEYSRQGLLSHFL